MNSVDQLSTRMFRRRISDKQFEAFVKNWETEEAPKRSNHRERIKELIKHGNRVTTGWSATSIRGYHTHWIIWKRPLTETPNTLLGEGGEKIQP